MPRRGFWLGFLLIVVSAGTARAQFSPLSLGASILGQIVNRKKAKAQRRKIRKKERALKQRVQGLVKALNSPEAKTRGEGLRGLMAFSQEVRNGTVRLQSRDAVDLALERIAKSTNPKVRRYGEAIRQNFDLARDPASRDQRVASMFERWRSPKG